MKTLLLSRDDVEHSICLSEVIDAVESAYRIFQKLSDAWWHRQYQAGVKEAQFLPVAPV